MQYLSGSGRHMHAPRLPADLVPLVLYAAKTCPDVTPSLLASQLFTESGFNARAVSPAGAKGIAQFTQDTWNEFASKDGRPDPEKDVFNPAHAIPAQARYNCHLAHQTRNVPGDRIKNMLAAYNAGPTAVKQANGVPPIRETVAYVAKVQRYMADFRYLDEAAERPLPVSAGSYPSGISKGCLPVSATVSAARSQATGCVTASAACSAPSAARTAECCPIDHVRSHTKRASAVNVPRWT
ncbi:Transglycosylase SLT domain-containing protein [Streptomyces sp. TLI_053]|uniref:lytic transglycosylase domain-containing protein n=1 Tax=Streptomyces sp. TLI_053 TaxID=1855352 RepID=UPI00087B22EF|nr:lytic transglycosylase domain-containing protein [Streptomyces sp. TLI_053]SDT82713.1 Transglycosylase SLT domain-containing protein [Streptomyces sp. TLI_053]